MNSTSEKTIRVGSKVVVEVNGEQMKFNICEAKTEVTYIRMGGAYDSSSTKEIQIGVHIGTEAFESSVSVISPLGKALLNKKVGDIVQVFLPERKREKFLVVEIND